MFVYAGHPNFKLIELSTVSTLKIKKNRRNKGNDHSLDQPPTRRYVLIIKHFVFILILCVLFLWLNHNILFWFYTPIPPETMFKFKEISRRRSHEHTPSRTIIRLFTLPYKRQRQSRRVN